MAELKKFYTIAVDFDGTLCENNFPDIGAAKPLVIEYIKRQQAAGAHIILYTCRENSEKRALLDEAIKFCADNGIELYSINENPDNQVAEEYGTTTDVRKLYADLYIDDKAVNVIDIEAAMRNLIEEKERISNGGDKCAICRYNTNDYVCHPHCGGCDGKSKFVPKNRIDL